MSELVKARRLWEEVFTRGFVRNNASTTRLLVASTRLLLRHFMSSDPPISPRERSLAAFEQWLFDDRFYWLGMVHLSPYGVLGVDRASSTELLALVVGTARMVLVSYKLKNQPGGNSLKGFANWLYAGGDAGAEGMLFDDLVDEVLMLHSLENSSLSAFQTIASGK